MTEPMTPERLAEIEARVEDATEGPWHAWDRGIGYELHLGAAAKCGQIRCEDVNGEFRETFKRADAAFIAAARTDVPDLLAEVRRLQAAVERVRDRQGVPMTLPELAAIRAIVAVAHPHHHLLTAIDAAMDVARDRSVTTEEVNDD